MSSKSISAKVNDWYENWMFNSFKPSAQQLGFVRIVYAIFNLLFLARMDISWISQYPDVFFHPPHGLFELFSGFPPKYALKAWVPLLGLLNLLLLFGWQTRWVSILNSIVMIMGFGFVFSFGNIYHINLWMLFPLVMSFTNWGAALSYDSKRKTESIKVETWPITLMALLVGFAFFTSGITKISVL